MTKKQVIILTILLVVVAAAIIVYNQTTGFWPWEKSGAVPGPTASPDFSQAKTEREKIMVEVAQKISQLSPEEPSRGSYWFVANFWFIKGSDVDFYAEYEDGNLLDRLLLKAELVGGKYDYKVIGFFTAGESDWILQSGKDEQFGKDLDLYQYDENLKKWVKKN